MLNDRMLSRIRELMPYFVTKKGNNRLSGDISSENYVPGSSGWSLFAIGDGEINNVTIRGEMHAGTIVSDEMNAQGGTTVWAKNVGRLLVEATSDTTFTITMEESKSGHFAFAQVGDILRSRDWQQNSIFDVWYTVTSVTDNGTSYSFNVTKNSGSSTTLPIGSIVVNYGTANQGLLFASANLSGSPFFDVRTNTSTPWSNYGIVHARLGRLDALTAYGVIGNNEFGAIYGTDLSNSSASSASIIISNKQVSIRNVPLTIHNGTNPTVSLTSTGVFKLGTNIGLVGTTGLTFDASTGDLLIGQIAGKYMKWDQAAGTITFSGALSAATGTFVGAITAGTIDIGGADATSFHVDSSGQMWMGDAVYANAPFKVTAGGSLTAQSGLIGGWTIASANLSATNISLISGAANVANITAGTGAAAGGINSANASGDIVFWSGSTFASRASAAFRVTAGGALTATSATISGSVTSTSGTIGGWTLGATTLTGGSAVLSSTGVLTLGTSNDVVISSAVDGTYRLWVGNASAGSAAFRVTKAGLLTATGVNVTGAINASSGSITGTLTMSGSGAIGIGATSASAGTGLWMDTTGLYGLASGVVQAKLSATTGAITAGAGNVTLDANGIRLDSGTSDPNKIEWMKPATAFAYATINSYESGSTAYLDIFAGGLTGTYNLGKITLRAQNAARSGQGGDLSIDNAGVIEIGTATKAWATIRLNGSVAINGHLTMGSNILADGVSARNIGSPGTPFENLYVNSITATTIIGTMTGSEWETAGNATIDANQASTTTTVYVVNQATSGLANLDVENNIIVGGTVDGVDIAAHNSSTAQHGATGAVVGTTNSQDISLKKISLRAGISSAGGAPLVFTAGTNLSIPVTGAIEFDGVDFYITI